MLPLIRFGISALVGLIALVTGVLLIELPLLWASELKRVLGVLLCLFGSVTICVTVAIAYWPSFPRKRLR